mmetsp:Transcript_4461/g.17551  ORF Transcript_4461/g.17551 Transcript_4461/m.17551 type:complete len:355 (+) Transcript_4461:1359-2423(+)
MLPQLNGQVFEPLRTVFFFLLLVSLWEGVVIFVIDGATIGHVHVAERCRILETCLSVRLCCLLLEARERSLLGRAGEVSSFRRCLACGIRDARHRSRRIIFIFIFQIRRGRIAGYSAHGVLVPSPDATGSLLPERQLVVGIFPFGDLHPDAIAFHARLSQLGPNVGLICCRSHFFRFPRPRARLKRVEGLSLHRLEERRLPCPCRSHNVESGTPERQLGFLLRRSEGQGSGGLGNRAAAQPRMLQNILQREPLCRLGQQNSHQEILHLMRDLDARLLQKGCDPHPDKLVPMRDANFFVECAAHEQRRAQKSHQDAACGEHVGRQRQASHVNLAQSSLWLRDLRALFLSRLGLCL